MAVCAGMTDYAMVSMAKRKGEKAEMPCRMRQVFPCIQAAESGEGMRTECRAKMRAQKIPFRQTWIVAGEAGRGLRGPLRTESCQSSSQGNILKRNASQEKTPGIFITCNSQRQKVPPEKPLRRAEETDRVVLHAPEKQYPLRDPQLETRNDAEQGRTAMNEIIDVHTHLMPPQFIADPRFGIEVSEEKQGSYAVKVWGLKLGDQMKSLFDPETQLAEMDARQITRKVISLPPFLFAYEKDAGFAREWSRACNEALSALCRRHPDRFWGLGNAPLQDPRAAAEELEHSVQKLGLKGVELGTHVNGQDLDAEGLGEFFAAADRLQAAILIHPANVVVTERLAPFYLRNLIGNPVETTICATRLLLRGVFERFPRVRICFAHGGGAFPYILGRIRRGSRVRSEIPASRKEFDLPRGMYFDCVTHDPKALRYLVDQCGIDSVVLGTDYPFDMGEDDPVTFLRAAVPEKQYAAILGENPARFLRANGREA
jgi:aminocarboxymuconate-semialdehyde decarboxylase